MTMRKISGTELRAIAKSYGLRACMIRGTEIVNIRKKSSELTEDIGWDEFEKALAARGLAVYKAEGSDFLKIMKDK